MKEAGITKNIEALLDLFRPFQSYPDGVYVPATDICEIGEN